jgi:hypothetical protein
MSTSLGNALCELLTLLPQVKDDRIHRGRRAGPVELGDGDRYVYIGKSYAKTGDCQALMTAIRQQVPAKVYTYLYRHDQAWLQQHSPRKIEHVAPPARCDWHERDRQLAVEVVEAAEQLKQAGYRGQISIAAIGRHIGQLGVLQKHPDKLPLTAAALQQVVETREAWAVRRIEQVATQAAQDGETLPRWQLIKRAGVERLLQQEAIQQALDHALNILNCPE